jgi:hypothetical protein
MHRAIDQIEGIGAYLAPRPLITVLGVKYLHLRMADATDLYITEYGLPFTKCLMPENHWGDNAWMKMNAVRLPGTSAVHRVNTKEVDGRSKEIVIKWNRMGQDIPGETRAADPATAEFNSPFMEFSLVIELRKTHLESPGRLFTHRPLAIYVPRKFVKAEQLGRRRHRMEAIERSHDGIAIDWNRNYAVIYEWLKGFDATEACREGYLDNETVAGLVQRSTRELDAKGFTVSDNKPQHIIVRPEAGGKLVQDRKGEPLYGLVDFELLKRTPEREAMVRAQKRQDYLVRQVHRFEPREELPPGLTPVTIMGVEYVYGQVESTGGALWVVGRDPVLFDYFLPEKWRRTPRTRLSTAYQIYETVTNDNVHLVWRVSRVGQIPDADPFVRREKRILDYGFNSPFEEFSIAMNLSRKGIETTYPRAIYMTGHRSTVASSLADNSRYESHAHLATPDGHPILSRHHEYLSIWGYWNAPDDALAVKDEVLYKGIDALSAYRESRLTQRGYVHIMRAVKKRLSTAGIEDLSLRGNHLLLSINRQQKLALDEEGLPLARICNFELLRKQGETT